ncbi:MAG TPA: class I SAM-dependent methyltransferase [Conexibacter sp.]|nr:class I SAM-dependent methyltransferase [Conexibacter sp.]
MSAMIDPAAYGEAFAAVFDAHLAPEDTDDVVGFLHGCVGSPPARLLELGVGTGRIARPLVGAGYDVTGVEASPSMVAALRDRPDGDRVSLLLGDFGLIELGGPYDLVYGADCPLSQLDPRERVLSCLRRVAASLRPGGWFVCDAFHPSPELLDVSRIEREQALAGGARLRTVFEHKTADRIGRGTAVVVTPDGTEHRTPVIGRYYAPSELDDLARQVGLKPVRRTGDWSGAPFRGEGNYVAAYRRLV